MNVSIRLKKVNHDRLIRAMGYAKPRALALVTIQALQDITPYVPWLSGELKDSTGSSRFEQGRIRWSARHARPQYDGLPNKTKLKNPQATMKWAEVAEKKHRDKWRAHLAREYHRAIRGGAR